MRISELLDNGCKLYESPSCTFKYTQSECKSIAMICSLKVE